MATMLIVEDDIDANEAVSEYLQEAGHTTIPAFDGDEAITLFAAQKIDLVVLDIMLPTVTGLVVLNSIRKTSQVPVLMLTALEDEYTQVTSFDIQADDYITKPFSMVIMGNAVSDDLAESLDMNAIKAALDEMIDFSGPTINENIIEKFVSRITPIDNGHYRWDLNFTQNKKQAIIGSVVGRKGKATADIIKTPSKLGVCIAPKRGKY